MRQWPERKRAKERLEIIPMIDVMMFLLVFFVLISINVLPALGLKISLPRAATPAHLDETRRVTLMIAADGALALEGQPVTLDELPHELEELKEHAKVTVLIAGDEQSHLQRLVDVLEALKHADVSAASIVAKPK